MLLILVLWQQFCSQHDDLHVFRCMNNIGFLIDLHDNVSHLHM